MEEKKTTVYTEDPFSYNYVALKKSKVNDLPLPTRDTVVVNELNNHVGKSLGLQTPADWDANYDKVFLITEWAKERSGLEDPNKIWDWIKENSKKVSGFGTKRIDDLYNAIKRMKDESKS